MKNPEERLWLFPVAAENGVHYVEVLIFGDPEHVALFMVSVQKILESWAGFERIEAIVSGTAQLGFRCKLAPSARNFPSGHLEAHAAIRSRTPVGFIKWAGGGPSDSAIGLVGWWQEIPR